jgi:hypothetical protein
MATFVEVREEGGGPLERKWSSYVGTGINARKGVDKLVLRSGLGIHGDEYAIVRLRGRRIWSFWKKSSIEVVEEIQTTELGVARSKFNEIAKGLGFKEGKIERRVILY